MTGGDLSSVSVVRRKMSGVGATSAALSGFDSLCGSARLPSLSRNMTTEEIAKFHTVICAKKSTTSRCDMEERCPYSHCLSWHRRNPFQYHYRPSLCPNVRFWTENGKMRVKNYCHRGRLCMFAHTKEEQMYHPLVYKTQLCRAWPRCDKYYCPFAHGELELRNSDQIDFSPIQGPEVSKLTSRSSQGSLTNEGDLGFCNCLSRCPPPEPVRPRHNTTVAYDGVTDVDTTFLLSGGTRVASNFSVADSLSRPERRRKTAHPCSDCTPRIFGGNNIYGEIVPPAPPPARSTACNKPPLMPSRSADYGNSYANASVLKAQSMDYSDKFLSDCATHLNARCNEPESWISEGVCRPQAVPEQRKVDPSVWEPHVEDRVNYDTQQNGVSDDDLCAVMNALMNLFTPELSECSDPTGQQLNLDALGFVKEPVQDRVNVSMML